MTEAISKVGKVQGLDHFVMPAMDTERAERFYRDVLGGRIIASGTDFGGHGTRVFVKLGQNHVGLFSQPKATIPKRETADSYPRGAFVVPAADFGKLANRIRSGSDLVKEVGGESVLASCGWEQGLIFTDSEGNLLEVFKADVSSMGIHHLHLDSLDLDASVRFYTEILSCELLKRTGGTAIVGVTPDQKLVLHQVAELSEVTKTVYRERHIAFYVTDENFHPILERIRRAGIEHYEDLDVAVPRKPTDLNMYFRDPGNAVDLQIINHDSADFSGESPQAAP